MNYIKIILLFVFTNQASCWPYIPVPDCTCKVKGECSPCLRRVSSTKNNKTIETI